MLTFFVCCFLALYNLYLSSLEGLGFSMRKQIEPNRQNRVTSIYATISSNKGGAPDFQDHSQQAYWGLGGNKNWMYYRKKYIYIHCIGVIS